MKKSVRRTTKHKRTLHPKAMLSVNILLQRASFGNHERRLFFNGMIVR